MRSKNLNHQLYSSAAEIDRTTNFVAIERNAEKPQSRAKLEKISSAVQRHRANPNHRAIRGTCFDLSTDVRLPCIFGCRNKATRAAAGWLDVARGSRARRPRRRAPCSSWPAGRRRPRHASRTRRRSADPWTARGGRDDWSLRSGRKLLVRALACERRARWCCTVGGPAGRMLAGRQVVQPVPVCSGGCRCRVRGGCKEGGAKKARSRHHKQNKALAPRVHVPPPCASQNRTDFAYSARVVRARIRMGRS